jgi:hypothetical protein
MRDEPCEPHALAGLCARWPFLVALPASVQEVTVPPPLSHLEPDRRHGVAVARGETLTGAARRRFSNSAHFSSTFATCSG